MAQFVGLAALTVFAYGASGFFPRGEGGEPPTHAAGTQTVVHTASPWLSTPTPAAPAAGTVTVDHCDDPASTSTSNVGRMEPGLNLPGQPSTHVLPVVTVETRPAVVVAGPPALTAGPDAPYVVYKRGLLGDDPMPDAYLARHAPIAAVFRVVECGPPRWDLPGGRRPQRHEHAFIYRPVTLVVEQPIRGAVVGQTFTTMAEGGAIGLDAAEVLGPRHRYHRGQRALMVLMRNVGFEEGAGFWIVGEKSSLDASGIATNDLFPSRRMPLDERLEQLLAAGMFDPLPRPQRVQAPPDYPDQ